MRPVLSPVAMRRLEQDYMRLSGTPALELMERAAREVCAALCDMLGGAAGKRALFLCGPGNNGGDGYAAARLFADAGGQAEVFAWGDVERLPPSAADNYRRLRGMKSVRWLSVEDMDAMDDVGAIEDMDARKDMDAMAVSCARVPDAVVDALLGIGADRPVAPDMARVIAQTAKLRAAGARVLAVDIPSGVHALTGRAMGAAVNADVTVTFEYAKLGHYLADGADLTGELQVRTIGMGGHMLADDTCQLFEDIDAGAMFPPRRRNSHKGDYGHLLIIAGSFGMAGAAALCARAALRSGVGLLTVACPERIVPIIQTLVPGAMALPLPEGEGELAGLAGSVAAEPLRGVAGSAALESLRGAMARASALVIGPGLSMRAHWSVVQLALMSDLPAVLDADALNIISKNRDLIKLLRPWHIVTPHPAEAARLLGERDIATDPLAAAERLHTLGPTVLYKGNATLVKGDERYLILGGGPGMATGGSGDVLSGVIGAQLARGVQTGRAAALGAHLCGRAGEVATRRFGETSMTSSDLPDALADVLLNLAAKFG